MSEPLPRVDDYRTDIDFETEEMIGGVMYQVTGSDYTHATRHAHLNYLLRGLVAPGYTVASDLKTRFSWNDDFATDSALVKTGTDPATGTRHLEEIVFEVVDEQDPRVVTEKVPRMIERGVRRVFAVFVKSGRVKEWSAEVGDWVSLHPTAVIEDPALVEPVTVRSLLDADAAADAVVRRLERKQNPEIQRIRQEGKEEGRAEGKAAEGKAEGRVEAQRQAVLSILELRGLQVSEPVREAVLSCDDPAVLDRWLQTAVTGEDASDLLRA